MFCHISNERNCPVQLNITLRFRNFLRLAFSSLSAPLSIFNVACWAWYATTWINGPYTHKKQIIKTQISHFWSTHSGCNLHTCSTTKFAIRMNISRTSVNDRSIFCNSAFRSLKSLSVFRVLSVSSIYCENWKLYWRHAIWILAT